MQATLKGIGHDPLATEFDWQGRLGYAIYQLGNELQQDVLFHFYGEHLWMKRPSII